MLDFGGRIEAGEQEQKYQDWLREHPGGLVLSLTKNRQGKYTVHKASCKTIWYDPLAAGQAERSPKVCCEDWAELEEWLLGLGDIEAVGLNRFCPQCK